MRNCVVALALFFAGMLLGSAGANAQAIAEEVLDACKSDREKYCSEVTLGEGRLLACFYAYQDKLSPSCEYALYDASVRLERIISALSYVATECRTEIETLCSSIKPGEGRIAQCLEDNRTDLGASCTRAMQDTGLLE
jgi:hypothetical protein